MTNAQTMPAAQPLPTDAEILATLPSRPAWGWGRGAGDITTTLRRTYPELKVWAVMRRLEAMSRAGTVRVVERRSTAVIWERAA